MERTTQPGRHAPWLALPPYSFVSPEWPHPRNHAEGHSHGAPEPEAPPLDPADWSASRAFREGVDLFNHGYYWESHEAFEALWNAAGREGPVAEVLKGVIKLAACAIKVRQHRRRGIVSHAERAAAHFERTAAETGERVYCGLDLEDLATKARAIAADPDALTGDPSKRVEVVLPFALAPGDGPAA